MAEQIKKRDEIDSAMEMESDAYLPQRGSMGKQRVQRS